MRWGVQNVCEPQLKTIRATYNMEVLTTSVLTKRMYNRERTLELIYH